MTTENHARKAKVVFKTPWTPEALKQFRKKTFLIQADLAFLLKTTQQRVNEWENGKHGMKRAYTYLMNELEQKVISLRRRAGANNQKYADLMLKEFGVEIKEEKWKSSLGGKKKSAVPSLSQT